MKSRKIGGSWTLALDALLDASRGIPTVFISRSTPQSVILLNLFYRWADYCNAVCDEKFEFTKRNETSCTVNGVSIAALSHSVETLQGYEGNVKLDEFSLQDNDDEIYANALPIATQGFRLDVIGRAAGQGNRFYQIYTDREKYPNFSRHLTTIEDAVRDGLIGRDGKPIDVGMIRANMTDEEFREQYLCEFLDESYSFLPYELLRTCTDKGGEIDRAARENPKAHRFYGYDVARSAKGDNAVLAGIIGAGERRYVTVLDVARGKSFDEQVAYIGTHAALPETQQIYIDSTGIGKMPSEMLAGRYYNVRGLDFTNALKAQMAQRVKLAFERREIVIPDDDDLLADLHSVRKSYTGANNVVYDAPKSEAGHGDRFWAIALALHASEQGVAEFVFV